MKLYDVSWGLGSVRHVRVRAEDAVDAATRIRERYGWRRSGSYTVDAKTRGDLCCEMPVERANGRRNLLVAANSAAEVAREAPTGRVAVLSIGPDKGDPARTERAGLMFDDGSDAPYCMLTDLAAFDALPAREDDWRRDLECIVYGPGLVVLARMPLRIRHTHANDHRPVKEG